MLLDAPIVSKSGRVALVSPTAADDEAGAALRSDPATRRFQRFMPERITAEGMAARRALHGANPAVIILSIHALKLGSQPTFVGEASIYRMDNVFGNSCEVGVIISPQYFGGALATDALYSVLDHVFDGLKFHRVAFHTAVDNVIIRRWIERVGGTLEGIERGSWSDGKGGYEDVCLYSILDKEWRGAGRARVERGGIVGAPKSRM
ncbi:acyl-CoA N-acyltransferase [Mycena latifolia]|nr:acyl-CoA N-acyltransferase [Mycena latifolia]